MGCSPCTLWGPMGQGGGCGGTGPPAPSVRSQTVGFAERWRAAWGHGRCPPCVHPSARRGRAFSEQSTGICFDLQGPGGKAAAATRGACWLCAGDLSAPPRLRKSWRHNVGPAAAGPCSVPLESRRSPRKQREPGWPPGARWLVRPSPRGLRPWGARGKGSVPWSSPRGDPFQLPLGAQQGPGTGSAAGHIAVLPPAALTKGAAGAGGRELHMRETGFLLKKRKGPALPKHSAFRTHINLIMGGRGAFPCLCPANNFLSILVWL